MFDGDDLSGVQSLADKTSRKFKNAVKICYNLQVMKTKTTKAKKPQQTNGNKHMRESDYETADEVRSLKGNDADLSAEAKKLFRLYQKALGVE